MNRVQLIVRADDAGSNRSVNRGIVDAHSAGLGLVRNISLMANGSRIEDAADRLANLAGVCFGVHLTLNAEWERVRWGPISPPEKVRSLIDKNGFFHRSPRAFQNSNTNIDEVFLEMDGQLAKLRKLGFAIRYADEHMAFGNVLPGFEMRFDRWCRLRGLINWRRHNRRLPLLEADQVANDPVAETIARLERVRSGIYTLVTHPAIPTGEMKQLGNARQSGEAVAVERDRDRRLLKSRKLSDYLRSRGVRVLRYDEVHEQETDNTPDET